jgi:hypothetical protein
MNCNFEKKRKKRKEKARYRVPVRFGLVKKEFKKVIFLVGSVMERKSLFLLPDKAQNNEDNTI